jgi:hypothetical protein
VSLRVCVPNAIESVMLMFAELLEAVKARLRANVAALSEDNWMYEAEEEPAGR